MLFGKVCHTREVDQDEQVKYCLASSVIHLPNNMYKRAWILAGNNKVLTINLFV